MQLQLGLVLTQWLHALSPQQDNNGCNSGFNPVVVPHTTGLNPVVVPHTTGLRHVVVPHTTVSTPSWSLSLRAVIELRHVTFPPGLNHGRHPYFYRMDTDTSTGLPARVSPRV